MPNRFRVALTADFFGADGRCKYRDIGLSLFDNSAVDARPIDAFSAELAPDQLQNTNGVIVLTPRVTANSLAKSTDLLAIGRFGVGYDNVDVAACTAADVVLFITAGAVDYSVAEATVAWMLALTHHLCTKDRLVREARWQERSAYMGSELRDRTLGIIGFGGIGRAVAGLLAGFRMQPPLVFDPFVGADVITAHGARQATLDQLMAEVDFVSLHCPLNNKTRNLIGARELALMKPTAYFINTARGGIVAEDDLLDVLRARRIAGAAIDCFVGEPLTAPPPFAALDNVLMAPHCIAWTDELFRDIGKAACRGMLDLAQGRRPSGVVNPEVFERTGFQAKWQRLRLT
jgi:phosphoglycerate dehydrogenase-like enzyme